MLVSVATENTMRMPTTTMTTTVCARATACEPRMLSAVITSRMRTAKGFIQSALPATAALA